MLVARRRVGRGGAPGVRRGAHASSPWAGCAGCRAASVRLAAGADASQFVAAPLRGLCIGSVMRDLEDGELPVPRRLEHEVPYLAAERGV